LNEFMQGWIVPAPKEPTKTKEELRKEREEKVAWLVEQGYLKSERIRGAIRRVARENFIPWAYRDYAYLEVPLPLPGQKATVSCPHSYPLFYEPLGLEEGHKFMEIGLGSGYGSALAREIVGPSGLVVSIEIDPITYEFAKSNLARLGYDDLILVQGDGGLGYPNKAPFDKICLTAACEEIPPPLFEQLRIGGRLIAPVLQDGIQRLILFDKQEQGITKLSICEVLYVSLMGQYGLMEQAG
jgi:protein-L-isoaspartate(D-aspartate) O-methyltransferase